MPPRPAWQAERAADGRVVRVNVSGRQLADNMIDDVAAALEDSGIDPPASASR